MLGHRARSGKDFLATYIKDEIDFSYPDVKATIIHWADALKREVRYDEHYPLLQYENINGQEVMLAREASTTGTFNGRYNQCSREDFPALFDYMEANNITSHQGMTEKDSPLLQAWGTGYRRKMDDKYWVRIGNKTIKKIIADNKEVTNLIMIPDTRFYNEVNGCHSNLVTDKVLIDITRYNEDGTRYYDPSRDKDHPSEAQLDDIHLDNITGFGIAAKSGDVDTIYNAGMLILSDWLEVCHANSVGMDDTDFYSHEEHARRVEEQELKELHARETASRLLENLEVGINESN